MHTDTASLQFTNLEYAVLEGNSVPVCVQLVLSGAISLGLSFSATLDSMNGTLAGKWIRV